METKQHRSSICREVLLGLGLLFILAAPLRAQYTADFQTNIISGVTSNWIGDYYVGSNTFAGVLMIQDTGALSNGYSYLGYEIGSSNNSAFVTGVGSVWSNAFSIYVGYSGSGNSLTISNGGRLLNSPGHPPGSGWLGYNASSSNNRVLIADTGSVWNSSGIFIGCYGSENSMVVSNGGAVTSGANGYLGYDAGSNNTALVTGSGSLWGCSVDLYIGNSGAANSLSIRDGGRVTNNFGAVGWTTGNNTALIADTGSLWRSRSDLRIGYQSAGNSMVISNGGRVTAGSAVLGLQYSGDNNEVVVTGFGSGWGIGSDLVIGFNGSGNTLLISDGGWVTNANCNMGGQSVNSGNNMAVITGSGSVWSNSSDLYIGYFGGLGNTVVISNSGRVINRHAYINYQGLSRGNGGFVTDAGSVWSNTGDLYVGFAGASGSFVVSNEARVISSGGYVGYSPISSNNSVRVVDGGIWENNTLIIGSQGSSNSVVIHGGLVSATNVLVGAASTTCDNLLRLDSGNLFVTNTAHTAVLEVRRGTLVLNGGTLRVDRFVMTNVCAQFVRNGGTFIYGSAVLDPNRDDDGDGIPNGYEQSHGLDPLNASDANVDSDGDGMSNLQEYLAGTDPTNSASAFRITSVLREGDNFRVAWMMGSGKTNALQHSAGDSGLYTTNFADIFIVTNTTGNVTNYLDVGGATNSPSRFYRVRLVP